jgi:hypothetical protein
MDTSESKPKPSSGMPEQYAKSALIVAHPDDEILFFSSIIDKVDIVIVCFLGNPRVPQRRSARLRVLNEYPLKNILTLDIETSGASRSVDWNEPVESYVGLKIQDVTAQGSYSKTYESIVNKLRDKLSGYKTVYTHNPWGEYGHADHVQVHRAVDSLARELEFQVLFSNYVSPKSMKLALPYISRTGYLEPTSRPTNINFAHKVRDLYIKEDCWTVPENFSWPKFESFNSKSLNNNDGGNSEKSHLFALNFILWRYRETKPESYSQRVSKKLTKIKNLTMNALRSN